MRFVFIILFLPLIISAKTRLKDISAWTDVPVKALDEHETWNKIALLKAVTSKGKEIRVYFNTTSANHYRSCHAGTNLDKDCAVKYHPCTKKAGLVSESELKDFILCSDEKSVGCNNVFHIENGHVTRYIPVGNCMTDDSLTPDKKYRENQLR